MRFCVKVVLLSTLLTFPLSTIVKAQLVAREISGTVGAATSISVDDEFFFWVKEGRLHYSTLACCRGRVTMVVGADGDVLGTDRIITSDVDFTGAHIRVRKTTRGTQGGKELELYWSQGRDVFVGHIPSGTGTLVDVKKIYSGTDNITGFSMSQEHAYWTANGNLYRAVLGRDSLGPATLADSGGWVGSIAVSGGLIYWITGGSDLAYGRLPGSGVSVSQSRIADRGFQNVFIVSNFIYWVSGNKVFRANTPPAP